MSIDQHLEERNIQYMSVDRHLEERNIHYMSIDRHLEGKNIQYTYKAEEDNNLVHLHSFFLSRNTHTYMDIYCKFKWISKSIFSLDTNIYTYLLKIKQQISPDNLN